MTEETQGASPAPGAELIGKVLAGRYRILELLGQGAMGSVYVGEHLKMGRKDAIKVLRKSIADDEEAIARFVRGAQHASKVRHPNVCSIYDFAESEDGTAFLAMELIDGPSLQDYLAEQESLPIHECVQIVEQVADGLQAAHDAGIVHRDLKPGNIMLTRGRSGKHIVKVVDFDIAKGSSDGEPADLTQLGLVIGTPEYMSPEQLTADRLDGRSDVYSLGIVLFRMLTGVPPFSAASTREMMVQRLTNVPYTLVEAAPGQQFPAAIQEVLDRALARNPDDRYPDAEAFAAALAKAGAHPFVAPSSGPTPDTDPSTPPPAKGADLPDPDMSWRRTKRRKRPVPYLIPGAVALVVAIAA
ncbi:MAG: serine/threonine-protein kinase, partial [Longimicrobiales bacterium]